MSATTVLVDEDKTGVSLIDRHLIPRTGDDHMESSDTPEKLAYSIKEFCRAASISRTKTYQLIADGHLATVKVGTKTLIRRRDAERFFEDLGLDS